MRACFDWLGRPGLPSDDALAARLIEAERREKSGDLLAAATILEQIWREQPNSPYCQEAKFWLAGIRFRAGQAAVAAADLSELLRISPAASLARRVRLMLGEIAEQGGDPQRARRYYAESAGATRDTGWMQAHLHQALCWLKQDEFAQAAAEFRLVVDNQKDGNERVRALFGGAYCYERLGRKDDAARLYRHVGAAYPSAYLDLQSWPDPFDRYVGFTHSGERTLNITWSVDKKLRELTGSGTAPGTGS